MQIRIVQSYCSPFLALSSSSGFPNLLSSHMHSGPNACGKVESEASDTLGSIQVGCHGIWYPTDTSMENRVKCRFRMACASFRQLSSHRSWYRLGQRPFTICWKWSGKGCALFVV